jgi:hypothetical protein
MVPYGPPQPALTELKPSQEAQPKLSKLRCPNSNLGEIFIPSVTMARTFALLLCLIPNYFSWCSRALMNPPVEQAALNSLIEDPIITLGDIPLDPHEFGIGFDLTGSYG